MYSASKTKRAKDSGFFGWLIVKIDDDETVVAVKSGDHFGEILRSDRRTELPVEFIHSVGRERMIINRLDRQPDLIGEKQIPFPAAEVVLEQFVGAVAGTTS